MSNTEPLRIGRYEIRGELGRGGMAVVYRAFDPQVKREVALKVLPRQSITDPDSRVRFEREAHTIATLEHPAIVPLYDFGEEPGSGQLFFVMRLMPGGSLQDRIRKGPLTLAEAARIFSHIAPALDEAHAKGIVHRDLKPANILFDSHSEPYISDFGIAKQLDVSTLSSSGNIMGTPAYMSPEQARGERVISGRSDIYALGSILFEMLTGFQPYDADTPIAVALKHLTDPIPNLLQYRLDLPPAAQTVLETAMAKDPQARYPSATNMAGQLAAAVMGEPLTQKPLPAEIHPSRRPTVPSSPPAKPKPAPPESRSWGWLLGATLAIGLLGFAAIGAAGVMILPGLFSQTPTPNTAALALATQIAATHVSATQIAITQNALALSTTGASTAVAQTQQAQLDGTATAIALNQSASNNSSTATAQAILDATATADSFAAATAQAEATNQAFLTAKKVAFFKDNDIWVVNVDGSNLQQVTTDGAAKSSLRWLPDGQTLTYISGRCLQSVHFMTKVITSLGCFNSSSLVEGFEVSPDGRYFAISVDRITYIGTFDPAALTPVTNFSQLRPLSDCVTFSRSATQYLRWSADMSRIAIMVIGVSPGGLASDTIQLLKFECGNNNPINYDQFPGGRFTLPKYSQLRKFQDFGWDGRDLFALVDYVRNDGFGDLFIYNTSTKRAAVEIDPLNGCCYRDPMWSPDGMSFVFAWQDQSLGSVNKIELYYAPYNTVISGGRLTPIPLPDSFFTDAQEKPHPVISPSAASDY